MWSFFACFSLSSLFEVANVQGRVFSLDNIYRARDFSLVLVYIEQCIVRGEFKPGYVLHVVLSLGECNLS